MYNICPCTPPVNPPIVTLLLDVSTSNTVVSDTSTLSVGPAVVNAVCLYDTVPCTSSLVVGLPVPIPTLSPLPPLSIKSPSACNYISAPPVPT